MIWWRKEGEKRKIGLSFIPTKRALHGALCWPGWTGEQLHCFTFRIPFRDFGFQWRFSSSDHVKDFLWSTFNVMVTFEEYEDFVKKQRPVECQDRSWLVKEMLKRRG